MRAWPLIVPTPPATAPSPSPEMQQENHHVASGAWLPSCFVTLLRCQLYISPPPVSAHSASVCLPQGPGPMRDWVLCFLRQEKVGQREWKRDSVIFSARSVEAAVFPPMSGGSVITVNDQGNNCFWIMIFMVRTAKFLSDLVKCAQSLSSVWLFATPMGCILPGFSFHGIFQARITVWVAISCSRDLPDPGNKPTSPASPGTQADLYHWAVGKAPVVEWVSV